MITATARDGAGVARAEDGRVIFVEGGLPGEVVRARVDHMDRRWARAQIVQMLEPSPHRVDVSCNHRTAGCGGCDLLHVAKDHQTAMKLSMVVDQLERSEVLAPDPEFHALINDEGRTTVQVGVIGGRAAYRIAGSNELVVPEDCSAVDPILEELLVEGRFGDASGATLRVGARTGERLVLVDGDTAELTVPSDVLKVSKAELAGGKRAWIHEEAGGRRWRVSARSFFQNRPAAVDALVQIVQQMVSDYGSDGPMIDAFAGVGIFAGTVGVDRPVTAVERSADSLADARINLADSGARIVGSSVESWRATPAATVLADPARAGLGHASVKALLGSQPDLLILISCDHSSFARDAALLAVAGLTLTRLIIVDLFPDTSHVETVGAFLRT